MRSRMTPSSMTALLDKLCTMFCCVRRQRSRVQRVDQTLDNATTRTCRAEDDTRQIDDVHEGMFGCVRGFLEEASSHGELPMADDISRAIERGLAM